MNQSTSWGSVFASIAGICGTVSTFLPPPYGMWVGILGGCAGVIATKIP